MVRFPSPEAAMQRALELAARGLGAVEPNPMVGAVLVDSDMRLVAEGWHTHVGGPHAEAHALTAAAGRPFDTAFVTLEPCNHHGRTPPCTEALIQAGVRRVVVATRDPAPHTAGAGIRRLQQTGVDVEVGLLEPQARALIAPFRKLVTTGTPWVLAKWAMTLDGRIATSTGESKWISGKASRAIVHEIRGRMDAIVVGSGTVHADDPRLTARPPGPRQPARIVLSASGDLPTESQLVRSAADIPVLLFAGPDAPPARLKQLAEQGVEVLPVDPGDLSAVLRELGRRSFTNVLIEGGGRVLGSFFDADLVDEVHTFIAPKVVGGDSAPGPVGGAGRSAIAAAARLLKPLVRVVGDDVYVTGRLHDN